MVTQTDSVGARVYVRNKRRITECHTQTFALTYRVERTALVLPYYLAGGIYIVSRLRVNTFFRQKPTLIIIRNETKTRVLLLYALLHPLSDLQAGTMCAPSLPR